METIPIQAIENIRLMHTWETWTTMPTSERTRLIYQEIRRLDRLSLEEPPAFALATPDADLVASWPRPWRDP